MARRLDRFLTRFGAPSVAGVQPATVIDNVDRHDAAWVHVSFPWASGRRPSSAWARLASWSAGDQRGAWSLPEVGDEVLVAFEGGDLRYPYVVGALWGSGERPPESGSDRGRHTTIVTRSGARVTIDDGAGDGAAPTITLDAASGDSVHLGPAGITMTSAAKVTISAGTVEISAGVVDTSTAMAKFSGVVHCDTLIANSVVAASFTPGAGNIW